MRIRLLADDLTGAMDTAVRLVPLTGPIPVAWHLSAATGEDCSLAFDLATRELDATQARQRASTAAALLAGADIAYLKCDSLLRGWAAEEIAGCWAGGGFDHCVIAPAFPAQRRVTRQGRQWAAALDSDDWRQVGPALADQLMADGLAVSHRAPGDSASAGISLWDAETDADLTCIVATARRLPGRILWCGTAGLAEALAGTPPRQNSTIRTPLLALVGSNHPVTLRQLAEAAAWHCVMPAHDAMAHASVADRLLKSGAAVVSIAVPDGVDRAEAAAQIAKAFDAILGSLAQPATLFAAGGETLRAICDTLGATVLVVRSEAATGVPVSCMRNGRWAGTAVISKSGAFGDAKLLGRLISSAL
jgi:D-threonate/D-erythronate kinase